MSPALKAAFIVSQQACTNTNEQIRVVNKEIGELGYHSSLAKQHILYPSTFSYSDAAMIN
jgi:hypothetical protein